MKTFREFLEEAEVRWNTGTLKGSKKSPRDTATQKAAQLAASSRTNPALMPRAAKLRKRLTQVNALANTRDPRRETTDTRTRRQGTQRVNTGYATFSDTPISSVGTTSDVRRSDIKEPRDVRIASRHGFKKTGPARSGGIIGG
jgi:hypothetical protein